jgi:5'-3' exoribonuclease 1
MGIPSYFSYVVKNYPNIIRRYLKKSFKVHNLYLDCNSIIYDAYNKMVFNTLDESVAIAIIRQVISKIEYYISIIEPSETVIIAFDGVAPVAKLEQQRGRRYKSWYQTTMSNNIFKKQENSDAWNTTSITPGTIFMSELNKMVSDHFLSSQSQSHLNISKIFVSGSDEVGEGEHKLFDYIRKTPDKHSTETTVIYGLDADLIMLSINHLPICPNIYLFRETPEFIKSIDSSLEPNEDYFLDIPEFANALIGYMNNDEPLTSEQQKNKMYDYIFMSFFLGNDFLPHFPALNIRTGGIDKMMNAYKATIGNSNENLTDGKTIYWKNVRKMVEWLVKFEHEYIINEHKLRDRQTKRELPVNTPEELYKRFDATPIYEREMEKYINPFKPYWEQRYYRGLCGIVSDKSGEQTRDICVNYLQGLEWTMKYYTEGCPDYRWRYKYNYPPLLSDLIKYIPIFATEFVPKVPFNPVSEMVQLCYVLPRNSLHLLPTRLYNALISEHDEWYKLDCEFIWAYCRYFWESHVELPEIDINELESFVKRNKPLSIDK